MCLPKPKTPKIEKVDLPETPAPPPPPTETAEAPVVEEGKRRTIRKRAGGRTGGNPLTISLAGPRGGVGVPQG